MRRFTGEAMTGRPKVLSQCFVSLVHLFLLFIDFAFSRFSQFHHCGLIGYLHAHLEYTSSRETAL
jgi:hypothetical protein